MITSWNVTQLLTFQIEADVSIHATRMHQYHLTMVIASNLVNGFGVFLIQIVYGIHSTNFYVIKCDPQFFQICMSRNIVHNWIESGVAISAISISYSSKYGAIKSTWKTFYDICLINSILRVKKRSGISQVYFSTIFGTIDSVWYIAVSKGWIHHISVWLHK